MKKKNITEMTEEEKIKEVEKLFAKIQSLFPGNHLAALTIHDIDVKNLNPEVWKVSATYIPESKRVYLSAERINRKSNFDITLFGKD